MSKRFSGPNSESPTLKVSLDSNDQAKDCPFRNVLDKIGDKWGVSVFTVLEDGPKRFNQLRRLVGKISHRVLTRKLRDLERDGYVSRTVHPVRPPKVEYAITPLGRSLLTFVKQFMDWTSDAFPDIRRAREAFDHGAETTSQRSRHL